MKTVCILKVLDDAVSIHVQYRNALDIYSKHTACTRTLMSLKVFLEDTTAAEFLLTNETREPSTFIVRLQQMCLQLKIMFKTV